MAVEAGQLGAVAVVGHQAVDAVELARDPLCQLRALVCAQGRHDLDDKGCPHRLAPEHVLLGVGEILGPARR